VGELLKAANATAAQPGRRSGGRWARALGWTAAALLVLAVLGVVGVSVYVGWSLSHPAPRPVDGHNVLMFDFRNSGESGGKVTTLGYREVNDICVRTSARTCPFGPACPTCRLPG